MSKQSAYQYIQIAIVLVIFAVSALFLFPPDFLIAKQISNFAIHWMLICLLAGILALFLNNELYLFACFISCGIMAFYLMNSFNTELKISRLASPNSIELLFANPTLSNDDGKLTLARIIRCNADVVLLEEFTPNWIAEVEAIRSYYPYQIRIPRADPLGKAILSKYPLLSNTQHEFASNPVLHVALLNKHNDSFQIIVSNSLPPITMSSFRSLDLFLDSLSAELQKSLSNVILAANFNVVPWSRELRKFRVQTGLMSSRRDNTDAVSQSGSMDILNVPNMEVYYSGDLECAGFQLLSDTKGNPIGVLGRYQHKIEF